MKVLYCKTFGLGNCVMAVPAIKALLLAGHQVDVLIGGLPDDVGAFEVLSQLRVRYGVGEVWRDQAPLSYPYDVAVLAIPFDGRWRNGVHFTARRTVDGRTRPDPSTTGLVSWKRHEVEYQMDNARDLGYGGETPSTEFMGSSLKHPDDRRLYMGVGYKKDAAGFWARKHWGNERFARLARLYLDRYPDGEVWLTGDPLDLQLSVAPIIRMAGSPRVRYLKGDLLTSMGHLSMCDAYVGNDTGMAHVAASMGLPTVTFHNLENSVVKSRPWPAARDRRQCVELDGTTVDVTPELMFEALRDLGVV